MRRLAACGILLAAGCTSPHANVASAERPLVAASVAPVAAAKPRAYPTIIDVPVPDYSKIVTPQPRFSGDEAAWYGRDQGLSLDEARRRIAAQQALLPEFERLQARLRVAEADNYTDARIVHQPDWAYVLYFKRDPSATLARYTSNPRFRAAPARYTAAELSDLIKPWVDRFTAHALIGGYGIDATNGMAELMMTVTEAEYREIAAREGWGPLPDAIRPGFARALAIPTVDPQAADKLRAFANDTKATTIQLEAGFAGKIILRDGCLRVVGHQGAESLAYFHRETGIGVDGAGYLSLIDRMTGKPKGRIGEMFSWAGPNQLRPDMPGLAELKAACGDLPVSHVGNPESKAAFDRRYSRN